MLVVIGIIAVLISILLPVLGRSCDQASRVKCLNMRQLYLSFEYAGINKGVVPIGYVKNLKQMNYMIFNNDTKVYQILYKTLWNSGIVKSPEIFVLINTTERISDALECMAAEHGRFQTVLSVIRDRVTARAHGQLGRCWIPDGWDVQAFQAQDEALFADCVSDRDDVLQSHKAAANVIYSDGSGVWVPQKAFIDNLKQCDSNFTSGDYGPYIYKDNNPNGALTGVWADLDAQQRVSLSQNLPGSR